MRSGIGVIAFFSTVAWAHGPQAHPTAAAPASQESPASADAQSRHSPLPQRASDRQAGNDQKNIDDRQRFCVRNQSGEVHCVVYPAGH